MKQVTGLPKPTPTPSGTNPVNTVFDWVKQWEARAILIFLIIAVVMFLAMLISGARSSSQRKRAAQAPLLAQKQYRAKMLAAIVETTGHDTSSSIRRKELMHALSWPRGRFDLVGDALTERGLITATHFGKSLGVNETWGLVLGRGPRYALTQRGLEELEKVEQGLETPDLAPTTVIVQVGKKPKATVKHTTNYGFSSKDLQNFVRSYDEALSTQPAFGSAGEGKAKVELQRIQDEMRSSTPRKAVIVEAGHTLRALAEGVGGNALYVGLATMAKHLGF